jgi:DNA-binding transcriptional regulator YhcF (GntR family)
MIIKKSQLVKLINESIRSAASTVVLPSGRVVPFASRLHIAFVQRVYNDLIYMRDMQPRARRGMYKAASRKVLSDAVEQIRRELNALIRMTMHEEDENK